MQQGLLRPQKAAEYIGVCLRQINYIAEHDSTFPRKIVLGKRCVGWRRESLDKWLAEKESAA